MSVAFRATPSLVAVINILLRSDEPVWGLQIVKSSGFPSGTIYPLLSRLESADKVASQWEAESERHGPRRRLYTLTEQGRVWAQDILASQKPQPAARKVAFA